MLSHKLKPIYSQLVCTKELIDPSYQDLIMVKSFSNGIRTAICKSNRKKVSFNQNIGVWQYE